MATGDRIQVALATDITASKLLTSIKTVDGSGSGLDADTLDNMQPAASNSASTIVQRDSSGNFSAGTITANLSGNATTATSASKLATARTIAGVSFDGTANIAIPYANLTGLPTIPTSLPANGGNADTVDGLHFAISTTDLAPGSSSLTTNMFYAVYE